MKYDESLTLFDALGRLLLDIDHNMIFQDASSSNMNIDKDRNMISQDASSSKDDVPIKRHRYKY